MAAHPVARHDVCREGDDGNPDLRLGFTNSLCRLQSVHHWHLYVHENSKKFAPGSSCGLGFDCEVLGVGGRLFKLAVDQQELHLRVLLRGDIPVRPDHVQGNFCGIPLHYGNGADEMEASIWPKDPELGIELLFAANGRQDFGVDPRPILRVNPRQPPLIRIGQLIAVHSVEAIHLIVPNQPLARNIVVPCANSCGLRSKCQALGGIADGLLRPLSLGDVCVCAEQMHRRFVVGERNEFPVESTFTQPPLLVRCRYSMEWAIR